MLFKLPNHFFKGGLVLISTLNTTVSYPQEDPYQWLEDVEGTRQLTWVQEQNDRSLPQIMAHPLYQQLYENSLEILNSNDRIPYPSKRGDYLYNLWQDDDHVRGLYRRTTLEEFRKPEPEWETILDLDELAEQEQMNWVYSGMDCLYPDYEQCLLSLSVGGADAVVVREFNIEEKQFVADGFQLPEAKTWINWLDKDSLLVGTYFGENSLTDSGYPRIQKIWHRGTSLEDAQLLYEGNRESVGVGTVSVQDGDDAHTIVYESPTFYTRKSYLYRDSTLLAMDVPDDAVGVGIFQSNFFMELKSNWLSFNQGDVVYASVDAIAAGNANFELFVRPSPRVAVSSIDFTKNAVLVTWLDNVKSRVEQFTYTNNQWQSTAINFATDGAINVSNTDRSSDDFYISHTSFLEPSSMYIVDGDSLEAAPLKNLPAMFDASKYQTQQYMSTSKDGTQIPYFVVMAKNLETNGNNPTLLYGYGGFEISYGPNYSASIGRNWLDQGGVYVLANIRGGGEFGPSWHQAALLKNRHKAFEDFESVAEDLIERGITSPRHLGIRGGSNGGLLVGSVFTRKPELFNAVVCQVPLLDMRRYHLLLAGASWMGEYGDPEEADMWEYIKTYSPYHNVMEDLAYPQILFTSSTRDDRVHPGHARKMVAKMNDMGHDVLYYENTEGGHGGAANNEQRAKLEALIYSYLLERLN